MVFYITCLIFALTATPLFASSIQESSLQVTASQEQGNDAIKCLLLCIGDDNDVKKIAKIIKYDLEFTDQLSVDLKTNTRDLSKKEVQKLLKQDISLYLSIVKEKEELLVAVKDTSNNNTLFNKKYSYPNTQLVFTGHHISNELIPKLTHEESVCMSTFAYCKQLSQKQKIICVSDYAHKIEKSLSSGLTLNVAPSFHSCAPLLFYSQLSQTKSQLKSFNLSDKSQQTICSYDGLNMQPSFSQDGSQAVLCMSSKNGNCELYLFDKELCKKYGKRIFKQLTHNGGTNTNPCLLSNGNVIFCSDFQTGSPQLYYLDLNKKSIKRLTRSGLYCAAPNYNQKHHAVVYTKAHEGTFQLFKLDLTTGKDEILTTQPGDKLDPCWSPCGSYVAFTYDFKNPDSGKNIPQIAIYNLKSKKIRFVTRGNEPKSFPAWTSRAFFQM